MGTCLVSLPPGSSFDSYYNQVFVRAIMRAGFRPVRADDIDRHRAIEYRIRNDVAEAAICVVDLTGRNVNVLYVLGLAHGMGKPVLLLVQNADDLPFDLRLVRHLLYRPGTAKWEDMLSLQLQGAIRDFVAASSGTCTGVVLAASGSRARTS